jgi:hypothetical protein
MQRWHSPGVRQPRWHDLCVLTPAWQPAAAL